MSASYRASESYAMITTGLHKTCISVKGVSTAQRGSRSRNELRRPPRQDCVRPEATQHTKYIAHTEYPAQDSWLSALKQQIASVLCSAVVLTPSICFAEPVLTNKPVFATDYASVVRKREGKAKSNLPSAKEAEALLEINEELFTTEALEGMSRCGMLTEPEPV